MRQAWRSLFLVFFAISAVALLVVSATMSTVARLLAADVHALVIGGNRNSVPPPTYVDNQIDNFIVPLYPRPVDARYPVYTPQELWPVEGQLTFDQASAAGVIALEEEMAKPEHAGQALVVLGYSSSTRIVSREKQRLIAAAQAQGGAYQDYPDVSFVFVSNVNRGNGGIMQRFDGWSLPILGITFDGATPTDSPVNPGDPTDHALDTYDISYVHDGWSDFPVYPLNLLAVANAVAGIAFLHTTYPHVPDPELTPAGELGDTKYYVIETDIVPLLTPLERIGVPRPILLAVDEPLRVLIETGYRRDISPGQPTAAQLVPIVNPVSLATNLATSVLVGLDDALQEVGLARPLGTQPSGPYGVGGDDADLQGLPSGLIPLTNPLPAQIPVAPAEAPVAQQISEDHPQDLDTIEQPEPRPDQRSTTPRPTQRGPVEVTTPKRADTDSEDAGPRQSRTAETNPKRPKRSVRSEATQNHSSDRRTDGQDAA